MKKGALCEDGSPLRPNIVWFNEAVPKIEVASRITTRADAFVVVGTSLVVYPAAGLVDFVRPGVPIIVVDPKRPQMGSVAGVEFIEMPAGTGMEAARASLRRVLG
jgi:NAD-dependent deacetylase